MYQDSTVGILECDQVPGQQQASFGDANSISRLKDRYHRAPSHQELELSLFSQQLEVSKMLPRFGVGVSLPGLSVHRRRTLRYVRLPLYCRRKLGGEVVTHGVEVMDLPQELPLFPLTGCLLLPGNYLPLNIFEARYLALVRDAQTQSGYIGMVQPRGQRDVGWPAEESPVGEPEVYPVGCAGVIERSEPQPDGRVHLLLRGVIRFRIRRELEMVAGYRRVQPSYEEFSADLAEPQEDRPSEPLLDLLDSFGRRTGYEFDLERLRDLPGSILLNAACAALPFSPLEKQALLEANGADEREALLSQLVQMESGRPKGPTQRGVTVH